MPELPEVETIKNDLREKILNKKIKEVDLRLKKIVKSSVKSFVLDLEGNKFTNIKRRGKLLIFSVETRQCLVSTTKYLLIHLRMTGQLIYQKGKEITAGGHSDGGRDEALSRLYNDLPNKHTHIIFHFSDKSQLFFNDLRRFGVAKIVNKKELEKITNSFGVEPLEKDFSLKIFRDLIKNKNGNAKAFLLNQKYIAGIGNIYADEILFEAKILPSRKINSLDLKEIKKIYQAIRKILKKAVKYRGTTFYSYTDARGQKGNFTKFLKVYKRGKKKCLRCKKGVIQKVKIAGRGTRYCNRCQK
ncbi:MAG: bifunctional DNA-formamidopyrimidine glycosylase/DNA-(apurinic or apyrimidinic site) lyase [Candidatus Andersenbacteria bacterium]|nr:bifunctional DNA-formamidopyrimidine glycosylase/DNA-(apurinic or apyrimidinic site) lyase [Candidatus Andersenbacteria bacterium]